VKRYSGFMNEVRYRRQLAIHFSEKETSMPYAHGGLCPMPMSTSRNLRKARSTFLFFY